MPEPEETRHFGGHQADEEPEAAAPAASGGDDVNFLISLTNLYCRKPAARPKNVSERRPKFASAWKKLALRKRPRKVS